MVMVNKNINIKDPLGEKESFDPCSLYEWRLNWLEEKVSEHVKNGKQIDESQFQRWWDEEEKVYHNNLRDMEAVKKLNQEIAILVPSHFYHVKWLRACLESCRKTGLHTVLAYDNPMYADNLAIERRFPPLSTLMLADNIIIKHKTWTSGVGVPHAWNMWYAMKLIRSIGFKYVFNLNGDCILERPEGLIEIREMLGDGDIIACEYWQERKYLGTMSFLAKTDLLMDLWNDYIKHLWHFNIGNAEARMGKWAIKNNLKVIPVDNPTEAHFKCGPNTEATDNATFRKILGLRHLHAELKVRRDLKMEPVEEKYCDTGPHDLFMNGHEKNTLMMYWKTKDKRFLEAWWQ